jgi:hypothetical protein
LSWYIFRHRLAISAITIDRLDEPLDITHYIFTFLIVSHTFSISATHYITLNSFIYTHLVIFTEYLIDIVFSCRLEILLHISQTIGYFFLLRQYFHITLLSSLTLGYILTDIIADMTLLSIVSLILQILLLITHFTRL